jgi:SAM-dependent methyltransferase
MIIPRLNLNRDSLVIEIASNDGCLLQQFKDRKIPVLGIEPAINTAEAARERGIVTETVFFNTETAISLSKKNVLGALVIGNNVLAHNPDLNDFVEGLRIVLRSGGTITMEFPHLLTLLRENQFDTIYHEHFSYFSLHSVVSLFRAHRLDIFHVEEIPTHGGSLRIYAHHADDRSRSATGTVEEVLKKEVGDGITQQITYDRFAEKVKRTKRALLDFLIRAKNEGKKVVGYGAPAKGNTLLNYCGIRTDFLDYTVDRSPHKQNKFLPGTHIPVRSPDFLQQDRPDYVLILPWNIKDEIMDEHGYIREWGGKFIIPIPHARIVAA